MSRALASGLPAVAVLPGWLLAALLPDERLARWLLPLLLTLPAWLSMAWLLRRGSGRHAVAAMLLWALALGVAATWVGARHPELTPRMLGAEAYRAEMREWLRTGVGAESSPAVFLPRQLLELAVFALLSLLSASALSMPLGAVLMNHMGCYVGSLVAGSSQPLLLALLGWHPWSLLRIIAYVLLGVSLARPLLLRPDGRPSGRLLTLAGVLLLADIGLKAALAPHWRRLLLGLLGELP